MFFVLVARRMFKPRTDFIRYSGGGGSNCRVLSEEKLSGIGTALNILRRQTGCIDWTQRNTLSLEDENKSLVPRTLFQMKIRIMDNGQKNYHCIEYCHWKSSTHTRCREDAG